MPRRGHQPRVLCRPVRIQPRALWCSAVCSASLLQELWVIRIDATTREHIDHCTQQLGSFVSDKLARSCWCIWTPEGSFAREPNIMSSSHGIALYWLYWITKPNVDLSMLWLDTQLPVIILVCVNTRTALILIPDFGCIIVLRNALFSSFRLRPRAGYHRPGGQESRALHLWLCGHLSCCCSQVNRNNTHTYTALLPPGFSRVGLSHT